MGQDNYRYDRQGYDVHLGGDRGANGARALDYPLDTQVDAAWPGLVGSEQLRLRPQEVGDLTAELRRQASSASGLPDRLERVTAGVRFGPSSWQEANNLADASGQVRAAVETYVSGLLAHLSQAAGLMDECNQQYAQAEQANDQGVRGVGSGLGEGPGTGGGAAAGPGQTPIW